MTYPRILLFGWIGLSILYLLNPRESRSTPTICGQPAGRFQSRRVHRRLYHPVRYGGAPLGTFLFLLLFFYLMRYRDIRRMIPFALLGAGADVAGVREDSGRRRPAALLGRPVLTLGRTVCFPISCTAS